MRILLRIFSHLEEETKFALTVVAVLTVAFLVIVGFLFFLDWFGRYLEHL